MWREQTPKLLMQSGIGPRDQLVRFGIPVINHLPGVGQNLRTTRYRAVFGKQRSPPNRLLC